MNKLRHSARLLPLLGATLLLSAAAGAQTPQPQSLPAETLNAALTLVRSAAAAQAPAEARIEVQPGTLDSRLQLAPCPRIQPYLPHLPAGARPWGRTRVGLRCLQGSTLWNVSLPVTVKVLAPALVSTAPLAAGSVIEAAHLQLAEVDWAADASPVLAQALAQAGLLSGRVLAHSVAAGQALRVADLRPRQWFSAGDTVRIVASGEGFSVSGEGQALSNGIEGQTARVRTDSGRLVSGQPTAERRVEVAL